jgi:hypothetical protein
VPVWAQHALFVQQRGIHASMIMHHESPGPPSPHPEISPSLDMDQLMSMFSRFFSPEIISEAQANFDRDASSQNKSIRVIPPDPISEAKMSSSLASISAADEDHFRSSFLENMLHNVKPRFPPLERLPCANAQVEKYNTCPNPGTRACTACNLVSYCSKVCILPCNPFPN